MAADLIFTEDEMAVDEGLGYPKAYAKLCRGRSVSPYSHGPPFTFVPYALSQNEVLMAKDFDEMFPIVNPNAMPTAKPKIFVSLMWKQLSHLGNAGFDPAIFRVDPYGNVLYYHADSASPLAWDIDHWFPCSRGGLTVPSNLRILQWQVCKKKHDKLEFLIPWWDLQVGISINQFLSIFASSNSDFRHRAFSLLFSEGENEELNASQTVDSHIFPQHFNESTKKVGLAPAAIVVSKREAFDASSTLKSLDMNRRPRSNSPIIAARKFNSTTSKENANPDMVSNPYQAIVMARDSLRQREETAKMQAEIQKLDEEMNQLKQKAEEEKVNIQELELVLIKRRRRAEKCRRLAEAQSSYRTMLEKMIRDAMHQSVIYKEQVRLNQAAANALMARLEAQKAICDSAEKELHRKFKQRDEIEKQIRPEGEQGRKRSRVENSALEEEDDSAVLYLPGNNLRKETGTALLENEGNKTVLCLPGPDSEAPLRGPGSGAPLHKELRVFLEEEQKASEAGLSQNQEQKQEEIEKAGLVNNLNNEGIVGAQDENPIQAKLQMLKMGDEVEIEEDEESRRKRGKGNVERWLQMLLENTPEGDNLNLENIDYDKIGRTDEIVRKMNLKYPQQETKASGLPESQGHGEDVSKCHHEEEIIEIEGGITPIKSPPYKLPKEKSRVHEVGTPGKRVERRRSSFQGEEKKEKSGKEKGLVRSESARAFRRIPSSPSLILGMKKGVDCIRKRPSVIGDDDGENSPVSGNNFIKSSIKTIKRAVKI
ncbi:hypothetical protein NMG60_11002639 [Bertholletia excelsa]